jgi:putative hydrolase of the HAD superfamily
MLRGVLFDLDDTLTDRARSIERLAPEFGRKFGLDRLGVADADTVACIRAGDGNGYATRQALCEHLRTNLLGAEAPSVEELVAFWKERFPACNVEREGATPMLRELRGRGLKLGIISNGAPTQQVKIDAMRIRDFFSVVLISDEVGVKKPDAQIFEMGLEGLGLSASDVVFVGDNPELDVAGAIGVGIRPIWLKCREEEEPQGVETITSLAELVRLLPV